jgi:two-component system NtrC family sensor kinase
MRITLKTKLVVSFLVVVTITGVIAAIVGVRLIGEGIVRQAQEKVRLDLNSARVIYNHKLKDIEDVVSFTSIRGSIKNALSQENLEILNQSLGEVREKAGLDILTIADGTGRVVFRSSNPKTYGDSQTDDELISRALSEKKIIASTQIVSQEELLKEGEDLARRARIALIYTPKAKPGQENEETSGMMLKAAAPIFDDNGLLIGALYGGNLINRNFELVDEIRNTVYQDARYKSKSEGTATIFQGNLRISTNVMDQNGERAIGTQVSAEVHEQVLDKGERWVDRAFVVNTWYITAYEPIRNIAGDVIGILYVGLQEQRFVDMKKNATLMFLGITVMGAIGSLIIAYFLATDLMKPIRLLVVASQELSKGNFSYRIEPVSQNELGELEKTFNFMASSLKERDDELKEQTQRQLIQSEKLASVGRLAAGVAHQINNPLTGVLTYSSLLLRKKPEDDPEREDLQVIVDETMRCREIVKDLLGFSKQTEPQKQAVDINGIIKHALGLTKNQALLNRVKVITELHDQLIQIVVDGVQIQEVFLNIILNAIDAMPKGGELRITTDMKDDQFVQIRFADTGSGISPENLDKIFDPFFTTKDASKGTGLGLAVVYGIIEKHRGKIWMESEVDRGTTCIIDLPVNASE